MKEIIPVAVSTDENYAVPTYIMLHSMMNNSVENNLYKVFILVEKTFSKKNQDFILSLQEDFDNLSLSFINMGDLFSDSQMIIRHTTIPSMYRLLLPEILKDYDKCIYADTDTIICSDMAEILRIDLGDNYVGGVRDIEADKYIREFNYSGMAPQTDSYINTGLLLMNLKKMREVHLVDEFMKLSTERLLFMDQDIINICCHGHIFYLPLKYNAMIKYRFINYKLNKYKESVTQYFTKEEIQEAYDVPVIIHYAQPLKPWQCMYVYKGEVWYNYIKNSISVSINMEFIRPFIKKNRKKWSIQVINFAKYILYKSGVYKYILKIKGIL